MQMIINGQHRDASDGMVMNVVDPSLDSVIDTVPKATHTDIEEAVSIAKTGKRLWKKTPLHERVRILRKFMTLVERDRAVIRDTMCAEIGKTLSMCDGEISACIDIFGAYCEKAKVFATETLPMNAEPGCTGDILFTVREPLGLIVCIIPFNYPVELYAQKVAPALVAGNAVIVKPSSYTPLSAILLTELLLEAGVPREVIQVVTGSGATIGKQLSAHPDVDAVSLTGSTEVGIETMRSCAEHLAHVFVELGGNDPIIIFDDADVDKAVEETLNGRASNGGQTCCATKRMIVQKGILPLYTEKLIAALKALKVGDPRDPETAYGPLISEKAAEDVEKQIRKTVEQGAVCALGGKRFNKTFMEPTVLTGVTNDMDIAGAMEVFGPVFPIIAFDTADEAIEIANQIPYGLASGVMTADTRIALKVAMEIEAGTCVINGCGNYRTKYHAFGGYKKTGIGREGCGYTLEEFTQVKTVVLKQMIG